MKPLTFMVYAHGRKVHARLVKFDHKPTSIETVCHNCGRKSGLSFVAESIQYGFFSDMHWDVHNCSDCQVNTAFQYEIELTLAKAIERLK